MTKTKIYEFFFNFTKFEIKFKGELRMSVLAYFQVCTLGRQKSGHSCKNASKPAQELRKDFIDGKCNVSIVEINQRTGNISNVIANVLVNPKIDDLYLLCVGRLH